MSRGISFSRVISAKAREIADIFYDDLENVSIKYPPLSDEFLRENREILRNASSELLNNVTQVSTAIELISSPLMDGDKVGSEIMVDFFLGFFFRLKERCSEISDET